MQKDVDEFSGLYIRSSSRCEGGPEKDKVPLRGEGFTNISNELVTINVLLLRLD